MSALMNAQQNKNVHREDHIGRMLINGFPDSRISGCEFRSQQECRTDTDLL